MNITISKHELLIQLYMQLSSHFLMSEDEKKIIEEYLDEVLLRCENNFSQSSNKYYFTIEGERKIACFNPYHSVQYMTFLYYFSITFFLKINIL